jgi:S-disulfanyl-L-cysteine oxidoreductase SoxD
MRVTAFILLVLWTIGVHGSDGPSVRQGVYTDEQATRGEAVYGQECASCHGPTLGGVEMAPALTGDTFLANWSGLTVADLFERIRLSMPPDNPGRLSRAQNLDVIAYMLKVGKYPSGRRELPAEADMLKQIRIETPER